jgi:SSS family solute:Na+ symporter
MACKSVNEGRKAAAINIMFILPLSAVVVGNAGWLGKAISVATPDIISPNTSPDEIFVVVASIVTSPGVFGFVMAALSAALMSTVDTLINATAAICVNDIYRPIVSYLKSSHESDTEKDRRELYVARLTSIVITALGVVAVLAFKNFPTVYEAHGFFHSTLTPPLVVAIFLGVFWKRFTPAGVITTFLGGVLLMILGARYPGILIAPFDHGIEMNPARPYSYIRAFYNIVVCMGVGCFVTFAGNYYNRFVARFNARKSGRTEMIGITIITGLAFALVLFKGMEIQGQIISAVLVILLVPIIVGYFVPYDEQKATEGLISSSIERARTMFKGSELNDRIGEKIEVHYKSEDGSENRIRFSKNDMAKMSAEVGDLVYISDKRKWLGGLKSIHSTYGEFHDEDGVVYIGVQNIKSGLFDEGRVLIAEKEM